VLIVGAGLAGLHAAQVLAQHELDVLVVDRRRDLTAGIRTSGIFVRRTLEDFALPAEALGPAIRRVVLYPPSLRKPLVLQSDRDEYRVADMATVYVDAQDSARAAGARVWLGVRYGGRDTEGVVRLDRITQAPNIAAAATGSPGDVVHVRPRFMIGADGARSRVARDLGLDVNRQLIVGAELHYPVAPSDAEPTFHCVVDPRLAPGYLAWVVDDGQHSHVGLAGNPDRLRGVASCGGHLRRLVEGFAQVAPGIRQPVGPVGRRGGLIPVGGVLRRIVCPDGLLVGDAAGAASPLTAGGLDPCLRLSDLAARMVAAYLRSGERTILADYSGEAMRAHFRGRLLLRGIVAGLREPSLIELLMILIRTPPGRTAAARVFFGDGSFPTINRSKIN